MIILKIIGSILVITSSAGVGMYFSSELKSRIEDLKELRKLVSLLRGDIRYASTPLPEAMHMLGRRHKGKFQAFLGNISLQLNELSGRTFSQIWKKAIECELGNTSLTTKDKSQLMQFGETLGYLDKDMQMNTIDLYLSGLEDEIKELSLTAKEKSYMYNTLGICSGIFIIIVMI